MADFAALREAMVARQIAARGITGAALLAAMREVPREAFVAETLADHAYDDSPLPIEAGQTISQPYIVALMIEAPRESRPATEVLEIGAGSGYAPPVLRRIAREVDRDRASCRRLAALAACGMRELRLRNVADRRRRRLGGWPAPRPTTRSWRRRAAATCRVAERQLNRDGGTLSCAIGAPGAVQNLVKLTALAKDAYPGRGSRARPLRALDRRGTGGTSRGARQSRHRSVWALSWRRIMVNISCD